MHLVKFKEMNFCPKCGELPILADGKGPHWKRATCKNEHHIDWIQEPFNDKFMREKEKEANKENPDAS